MEVRIILGTICVLLSVVFVGCTVCSSKSNNLDAVQPELVSPKPDQIIRISDKEVYFNREGWTIPAKMEGVSSVSTIKSVSNGKRTLQITVTRIVLDPILETEEPFSFIDFQFKRIGLLTVNKFSAQDKVICYQFMFTRVQDDGQLSGAVSYFSYYDDDGDGKFESLYLADTTEKEHLIFGTLSHMPAWVQ